MSLNAKPKALFRQPMPVRLILARRFIGKDIKLVHTRSRRRTEDVEIFGRVLTVALIAFSGTRDVIVLNILNQGARGFPLAQVRSIVALPVLEVASHE